MKTRIRTKYTYDKGHGYPRHTWEAIGGLIAMHLHITDLGEQHEAKYGKRYDGGLEIHYRQPPEYRRLDAPDHDDCWLLHAPCWHDGSSLIVDEEWLPTWLAAPNDIDRMLELLAADVQQRQIEMIAE